MSHILTYNVIRMFIGATLYWAFADLFYYRLNSEIVTFSQNDQDVYFVKWSGVRSESFDNTHKKRWLSFLCQAVRSNEINISTIEVFTEYLVKHNIVHYELLNPWEIVPQCVFFFLFFCQQLKRDTSVLYREYTLYRKYAVLMKRRG